MRAPLTGALATTLLFAAAGTPAAADVLLPMQVLSLDAQVDALERRSAPAAAELAVFIGSQRNELRLRKLSLRIDERPALVYEYGDAEWEAIFAGGLHPALQLPLEPGPHRLRLELSARTLDAGPGDPRAVQRVDQTLELAAGRTLLEIVMSQPRFGGSELSLHQTTDDAGPDLWRRAARFWLDADRPWLAARLLTRLQHRGGVATDGAALLSESMSRLGSRGGGAITVAATAPVDRFNAAAGAQDLVALEAIGSEKASSPAAWILRDRANLLLGYARLHAGDGKGALDAFARVRSPGPHGNAALLGFGWAFLVPDSPPSVEGARPPSPALQGRPAFLSSIERRAINRPSRSQDEDEDRKEALARALVPWTELIGLDPMDLDAQEGALALAWALDQLGTGTQSHIYYERAAAQLERARTEYARAMEHVASGGAAQAVAAGQSDATGGWRAWLADLPYADTTGYMKYLLADDGFVAALDAYRDARQLRDAIEDCERRLQALPADSSLTSAVLAALPRAAEAERVARASFDRSALDALRARKQQTERYLVEARVAMARHFDNAQPPEVEIRRDGERS